jgi:hypothetical protein
MTDEEARLQRPQGVDRRRRRLDLGMGQRNAEFRHAKRKALTPRDRDRAAYPRASDAIAASGERQAHGLLVQAPFGEGISPR